ncbi:MAG: hypothetical protein ACI4GB_05520 [Acutalibacteraceae bacterium]
MKKKLKCIPTIDLRNYPVEALKKIRSIEEVATVIIPADADIEWEAAFAEISLICVADVLRLKKDDIIQTLNGFVEIDDSSVDENCLYRANGCVIVKTVEKCPRINVNGFLIKFKSSPCIFESINGRVAELEDGTDYKFYSQELRVTLDTVKYLPENITLIAGQKIDISPEVTEESLAEKKVKLIAGQIIECSKKVYGYVSANSTVGHIIKIYD